MSHISAHASNHPAAVTRPRCMSTHHAIISLHAAVQRAASPLLITAPSLTADAQLPHLAHAPLAASARALALMAYQLPRRGMLAHPHERCRPALAEECSTSAAFVMASRAYRMAMRRPGGRKAAIMSAMPPMDIHSMTLPACAPGSTIYLPSEPDAMKAGGLNRLSECVV